MEFKTMKKNDFFSSFNNSENKFLLNQMKIINILEENNIKKFAKEQLQTLHKSEISNKYIAIESFLRNIVANEIKGDTFDILKLIISKYSSLNSLKLLCIKDAFKFLIPIVFDKAEGIGPMVSYRNTSFGKKIDSDDFRIPGVYNDKEEYLTYNSYDYSDSHLPTLLQEVNNKGYKVESYLPLHVDINTFDLSYEVVDIIEGKKELTKEHKLLFEKVMKGIVYILKIIYLKPELMVKFLGEEKVQQQLEAKANMVENSIKLEKELAEIKMLKEELLDLKEQLTDELSMRTKSPSIFDQLTESNTYEKDDEVSGSKKKVYKSFKL